MSTYRRTAMAVITCTVGLSLAACTVAITSAGPGPSPSPAASHARSAPAAPSSHPASPTSAPVTMVRVNAPIGSFPIPPGATVDFNISCPKQISLMASPVTPSQSLAFYTTELPRAGYKIHDNMTYNDLVQIDFSGHGYNGSIGTLADLNAAASAIPSIGTPPGPTKNVEQVVMYAAGTPDSYTCPD